MTLTKPSKIALAGIIVIAGIALIGIGVAISGGDKPTAPANAATATATAAAATTPAADPYTVYLATNPDPSLVLSREDAQTRALLGCGKTFAPGTIDAALAAAYRPTGICK